MEEKQYSSQFLERSKIYNSPKLNRVKNYTKSNDSDDDRKTNENHLRNKLDNAFSDLESLRSALKNIKSKNENSFAPKNSNKFEAKEPRNNWEARPTRFSQNANDFNYSNDEDERNGGSRSNSKNKSLNYNSSYANRGKDMNSYYKTPKASNAKSKFSFLFA